MIKKVVCCGVAVAALLGTGIPQGPPQIGPGPSEFIVAAIAQHQEQLAYDAAFADAQRAAVEHAKDIDMIAKVIYREARGVPGKDAKAAVAWCILNRVDDARWSNTIRGVITQKHQFAWRARTPVTADLRAIAEDVFIRWQMEKAGIEDVGRVLPCEYVFFAGRGGKNYFRTEYRGGKQWDLSAVSPYETQK
jgi:hypothetical protein